MKGLCVAWAAVYKKVIGKVPTVWVAQHSCRSVRCPWKPASLIAGITTFYSINQETQSHCGPFGNLRILPCQPPNSPSVLPGINIKVQEHFIREILLIVTKPE